MGVAKPRGGQQWLDLSDGLGHGAPVDIDQLGQGRVGEVQPQVREGDQDLVHEDQPAPSARTCGPKAFPVVSLVHR
ncbi:hypothetical protein ACIBG6_05990 [Streptomyces sp. NPDC050842]|uniref:hypothetical protein n=1 Tax=Streptomyces sp. NPDC050842 TaxID=3365636 RepID=UPI003794588D